MLLVTWPMLFIPSLPSPAKCALQYEKQRLQKNIGSLLPFSYLISAVFHEHMDICHDCISFMFEYSPKVLHVNDLFHDAVKFLSFTLYKDL